MSSIHSSSRLAAEDLRRRISRQTKVGLIIPPIGMSFPHLQLDWEDPKDIPNSEPFCKQPSLPKNFPYYDQKQWEEDQIEVEVTHLEFPFTAIESNTELSTYLLQNGCNQKVGARVPVFCELECSVELPDPEDGDVKENHTENSAENLAETPVETPVGTPKETPLETSSETPAETPSENKDVPESGFVEDGEYVFLQAPVIKRELSDEKFGPPLPPNFDTKVLNDTQLEQKQKEIESREISTLDDIEEIVRDEQAETIIENQLLRLLEQPKVIDETEDDIPLLEVTKTIGLHNVEDVGPTPDQILQTLTLSKSSDGFNLERLEMLGDCFLKYAVTCYLYCKYEHQHEGQLSFLRSKKVSNRNLFRLGVYNDIPGRMVAEQFMQNDTGGNWLPPGYFNKDQAALDESDESDDENDFEFEIFEFEKCEGERPPDMEEEQSSTESADDFDGEDISMVDEMLRGSSNQLMSFLDRKKQIPGDEFDISVWKPLDTKGRPINTGEPLIYNHYSEQYLTDKSIADCMEALIGAYLKATGIPATQQFLCHMGLIVLPASVKLSFEYISNQN